MSDDEPAAERTRATREAAQRPAADPTAGLTFNLRLTDAERKAQSSIELPYVAVAQHSVRGSNLDDREEEEEEDGAGAYEAALREDDPDDDLDI